MTFLNIVGFCIWSTGLRSNLTRVLAPIVPNQALFLRTRWKWRKKYNLGYKEWFYLEQAPLTEVRKNRIDTHTILSATNLDERKNIFYERRVFMFIYMRDCILQITCIKQASWTCFITSSTLKVFEPWWIMGLLLLPRSCYGPISYSNCRSFDSRARYGSFCGSHNHFDDGGTNFASDFNQKSLESQTIIS